MSHSSLSYLRMSGFFIGDFMIEKIVIILLFICSIVSVYLIFDSRNIMRKRVKLENQNKIVLILKIVGFILLMFSLLAMYFYVR